MKPEDIKHLSTLGISIDTSLLYSASSDDLVRYARDKLLNTISQIERSAKEYRSLGEDGISSLIVTTLNATMVLVAEREANSRGRVDLTITAPAYAPDHKFRYLGEAKVWSTKQYCINGFEQLMGYITGRHKNSFTIIYYRINECDDQFKEYLTDLLIQKGGRQITTGPRFSTTEHTHSSTANIDIDHYAVHLPK